MLSTTVDHFFFFFSARGVINIDNSLFIGKKQKKNKEKNILA
jgi:hypothetical protein